MIYWLLYSRKSCLSTTNKPSFPSKRPSSKTTPSLSKQRTSPPLSSKVSSTFSPLESLRLTPLRLKSNRTSKKSKRKSIRHASNSRRTKKQRNGRSRLPSSYLLRRMERQSCRSRTLSPTRAGHHSMMSGRPSRLRSRWAQLPKANQATLQRITRTSPCTTVLPSHRAQEKTGLASF